MANVVNEIKNWHLITDMLINQGTVLVIISKKLINFANEI